MSLNDLRQRIDELDGKIVRLVNERAQVSGQVGEAKRADADAEPDAFRPDRERAVYERILALNQGPLSDDALKAIYREIMSASLALQMPATISVLGPEGSFTHVAAISKFGSSVRYAYEDVVLDVFETVRRGRAPYGVVPIENSVEGGMHHAVDRFEEIPVHVVSEVFVPIHQNFMRVDPETPMKVLYSHPQGFNQCRRWLERNHFSTERVEMPSTSAAARRAAGEPAAGAIASEMAADLHGLEIIESAIEDDPNNITRFFVIGMRPSPPSGSDKTSLLFRVRNESGSLYDTLAPFKREGINLTSISVRPSRLKPWEHCFFVDLEGHVDDPTVHRAIKEVESLYRQVQVLGSYPAAKPMPLPTIAGEVG